MVFAMIIVILQGTILIAETAVEIMWTQTFVHSANVLVKVIQGGHGAGSVRRPLRGSAKLKISWHDQRYSGQNARISAHYFTLLIVSWLKNQYGGNFITIYFPKKPD
jgi:hypothetical protein